MKILHLPHNYASQISTRVQALRKLGYEVRGLVGPRCSINTITGCEVIKGPSHIKEAIRWADIIHWHSDYENEEYLKLGSYKKMFVTFHGGDIRRPDIVAKNNPYYDRISIDSTLKKGDFARSDRIQKIFAQHEVTPIVCRSMSRYLRRDLFSHAFLHTRQWINNSEYLYGKEYKGIEVISHITSSFGTKGTSFIKNILSDIKGINYNIIHNIEYYKSRELLKNSDLVIDQVALDDYGVSSVESMAMGRVTLCYLTEYMKLWYPPELPIIIVNIDNLQEKIEYLKNNPEFLIEISKNSVNYVKNWHNSEILAKELVDIYKSHEVKEEDYNGYTGRGKYIRLETILD